MFDLNQAIAAWSEQMRSTETCRAGDVSELESHLRDTVADLSASGLSEEEAFWVAARRLGDVGELAQEFGKINPALLWRHRLFWMASGCLVFLLANSLGAGIASLGISTAAVSGFPIAWVWLFPVVTTTLLVAGIVVLVRWLLQRETFGVDAYFLRITRRWVGCVLLAVAVSLVSAGAVGLQICSRYLMVRMVNVEPAAFRQVYYQTAIFGWAWSVVVAPVLLVLLVLWLRPSKRGALAQG